MSPFPGPSRPSPTAWQVGPGTPVGVCCGPALGLALGDVALGFAAGLGLGAAADAVLVLRRRRSARHPGPGAHERPGRA